MRKMTIATSVLGLLLCGMSIAKGGTDVAASPAEVQPILIGAEAPNITVKTGAGEAFDLNAAFARKPTVLILYRGGW